MPTPAPSSETHNYTPQKRPYTVGQLLRAVSVLVPRLPTMAAIWGGHRMDPALREEIMVAVARVNACRHCAFAHHEWALAAGLDADELARVETGTLGPIDAKRKLTIQFAEALADSEFREYPHRLAEALTEMTDPTSTDDVETVARTMAVANGVANRFDAFWNRLSGRRVPGSRLLDELVMASLYAVTAPVVVLFLSVRRRTTPTEIVRRFRRFRP